MLSTSCIPELVSAPIHLGCPIRAEAGKTVATIEKNSDDFWPQTLIYADMIYAAHLTNSYLIGYVKK